MKKNRLVTIESSNLFGMEPISVVIAMFNGRSFIEEQVASIVNQITVFFFLNDEI